MAIGERIRFFRNLKGMTQKYLGVNKSAVSLVLPKKMETVETKAEIKHCAEKISEKNGVEKFIIDNKSTLLINKHNNNDIIAMSIIAKGGEFVEKVAGEGTLVAGVMLKGTQKYSAQELAQIMEENGIQITPACGEDLFVINVQTTTAQIDLTFDILNEILNKANLKRNEG